MKFAKKIYSRGMRQIMQFFGDETRPLKEMMRGGGGRINSKSDDGIIRIWSYAKI